MGSKIQRNFFNAFETAGIPLPLPQQQIWLSRHNLIPDQKN